MLRNRSQKVITVMQIIPARYLTNCFIYFLSAILSWSRGIARQNTLLSVNPTRRTRLSFQDLWAPWLGEISIKMPPQKMRQFQLRGTTLFKWGWNFIYFSNFIEMLAHECWSSTLCFVSDTKRCPLITFLNNHRPWLSCFLQKMKIFVNDLKNLPLSFN